MTRATNKNVNEAIADLNIELVKGEGYFYFAALEGAPIETNIPESVYVTRIRDLTLEEWVEAAQPAEEAPAPKKSKSGYIRGSSIVGGPCGLVHAIADQMIAENPEATRKEIMAACMAEGVTYGTARTQYQKWKNKG